MRGKENYNFSLRLLIECDNSFTVLAGNKIFQTARYSQLVPNPCTWRIDPIFNNVRIGVLLSPQTCTILRMSKDRNVKHYHVRIGKNLLIIIYPLSFPSIKKRWFIICTCGFGKPTNLAKSHAVKNCVLQLF